VCEGAFVGPLGVLDLSAAGFAAAAPAGLALAPGSLLESFELLVGGHAIWAGDAVVVRGSDGRVGGRFTSGILDLRNLRLGATLDGRLAMLREQRERLPAEWRAAVGDLRQLLEDVRYELAELEQAETHDPLRRGHEETELFAGLRARWGTTFYGTATQLHQMSKGLDERAVALGQSYASSMLMPLLMACPFHRRAYEKPLGYAGDYRMMELLFAHELGGEGLYGRFLHSIAQNYSISCAARGREVVMRRAAQQAIEAEGEGPVRILALAAGGVVELRRLLEQTESVNRPVEFLLLDQDDEAHETAHRHLTRILLEQHRGLLPVTVRCLHFSVRQLIRPATIEDVAVVENTLANLDLVYAAGLYDYLPERVAGALTRRVYGRLRPGGRMLLGNLVETPDSTWIMDYVWDWPLVYRTDETLLRLADSLSPTPACVGITRDETERCLFLDVTKPTSD
jgi:extracellular factor (EF) 3-hydroxypalmitic acid methyl ester biosynthesis protein